MPTLLFMGDGLVERIRFYTFTELLFGFFHCHYTSIYTGSQLWHALIHWTLLLCSCPYSCLMPLAPASVATYY